MKKISIGLSARLAAGVLCGFVVFAAGCGKTKDNGSAVSDANTTSKDFVYRQEQIKLAEEIDPAQFSVLTKAGDKVYAVSTSYGDEGASYNIYSFKPDGSDFDKVTLPPAQGTAYNAFSFDAEGNIYAQKIVYAGYEKPEDGEESTEDVNYIVRFDNKGNEVWKTKVKSKVEGLSYYVGGIVVSGGDGVVVANTNGISRFGKEDGYDYGEVISAADSQDEYGSLPMLFRMVDGRIVMAKSIDSMLEFYEVEISQGKLSDKIGEISYYDYDSFFAGAGGTQDILATGENGVYALHLGDAPVQILNYVDSDFDITELNMMAPVSDTEIVAVLPGAEEDDYSGATLARLIKVPPEDVKDKKVITLGCYYIDTDVRAQVINFNKNSLEYRIRIIDYSEYDTEDDWDAGSNKLSTDIVSGNTPDILVLDSDMPVDSYISKGLFEDLTPFMEKDEEISGMKYLDNIMDLFKTDGKMYQLVPYFNIETVAAAKADYEKLSGWTIKDLEQFAKDRGVQPQNIFGPFAQEDVMSAAIDLTGSQFINWNTKECYYDTDNFIELLEFIARFPEELTEEEDMAETSAYWRNGTSLLQRLYLSTFSDYNYMKKGVYGQDIVLCGFPSEIEGSSGASVYPGLRLSMSSTSKVKDGSWEFMRVFLGNEFQSKIESYWPMSIARLDELAERAQNRPYYLDGNGNKVEYDDTWYIGDLQVPIDPMTKQETQEVIDYLKTMDSVGSYSDDIMNIIYEEAGAFFKGQKTAKEVADIIQSRIQIYVNENS